MPWIEQPKSAVQSLSDFIAGSYHFETQTEIFRPLDIEQRANEAYLAVQCRDKATGEARVFAGVCAVDKTPSNIAIKRMAEHMVGTDFVNCPKRILDQLSDTSDPVALKWRGMCLETEYRRRRAMEIEPGAVLQFTQPVHFTDGQSFSTFQYEGRNTFSAVMNGETIGSFHIPNWRESGFHVRHPLPENTLTWDFKDGAGQVPAHRHPNGGGLVANSAWVDPAAFVARDATVGGFARVYGKVRIEDRAAVRDYAVASGMALIAEETVISDYATVSDLSTVRGVSKVGGQAVVGGFSLINGYAAVNDQARVLDRTHVGGRAQIGGMAVLRDQCEVDGRAIVAGAAVIKDAARVTDRAQVGGKRVVGGVTTVAGQTMLLGKEPEEVLPENVAILPAAKQRRVQ